MDESIFEEINNKNIGPYIDEFKKKTLKEKQSIIYEQMKMLAGAVNNMALDIGTNNEMIINRELADLNSSDYTEDDFAEAIMVLLCSIQNSICDYALGVSSMLDQLEIGMEE